MRTRSAYSKPGTPAPHKDLRLPTSFGSVGRPRGSCFFTFLFFFFFPFSPQACQGFPTFAERAPLSGPLTSEGERGKVGHEARASEATSLPPPTCQQVRCRPYWYIQLLY